MDIESKLEMTYTVQPRDLADQISVAEQDIFPKVLSTSRMIALMEVTAARLMKPLLKEGELSVGVNINATHIAATPVGEEVTFCATYKGLNKKLYEFKIELIDKGGKAGVATHTRAIVNESRLIQGAKDRVKT